ncbi:tyrosine-type recombinase/integrase [Pseudooceanicola nitratireducens]|uniref:site-specific integrase n=1 Tax=Pseudooceanicola nitratireducens TaxID=517719 RepID=UPI001C9583CA|nr:tyrosine-type recombinase/integrase [Pseudooceanicola nitratireducens]MBY6165927.1 tyrosine-type recombinase/integrase [Pseudooceanicola nitratireducens]
MLLPVRGGRSLYYDGGDEQRREILADEIERVGGDPLLHRAVIHPHAELPLPTVADAARLYEKERLGPNPKKSAKDTFKRVVRRLEVSLGPLGDLPLASLTRDQARKVRDDLLATPKKSGQGLLLVSSVQRELNSIKAMIALGIMEHDLKGEVSNPFENLSMPASTRKGFVSEWEERDPLPDEILVAVRRRILTRTRRPDLKLIWRLLQATGCRGAEISGLQIADVVLDAPIPHLWVRWNAERQLKTKTSTRPIPLIGDGLNAAKAALQMASQTDQKNPALFPFYSHEGGPDAASGALMNHVRNVTKNPRHVVYSLRHNIKSWLGQSGASERDENRLLGHAEAAVGNRYYGGIEDRLRGTSVALEAALALAPEGAWRTDY